MEVAPRKRRLATIQEFSPYLDIENVGEFNQQEENRRRISSISLPEKEIDSQSHKRRSLSTITSPIRSSAKQFYMRTKDPFIVAKCTEENNNQIKSQDLTEVAKKTSNPKMRSISQSHGPTQFHKKLVRQRSNTIIGPAPLMHQNLKLITSDCEDGPGEYQLVDVREEILQIKDQFDSLLQALGEKTLREVMKKTALLGKQQEPNIKFQLLAVLAIAIGHFLDGNVLAYPSPAIPSLNSTQHYEAQMLDFVRSFHSLGAALTCVVAGMAMNLLGRRGSTLFCTIPAYFIGFVMIGAAPNIYTIIAGRFLTGIGLGLTLCIPAVYIVEISSSTHRGVLGVIPNLFCQLGIFATYVTGHWLDWSWLAFAISLVCIPFGIAVWLIPESPTFLLAKNRTDEAADILNFLDREPILEDFLTEEDLRHETLFSILSAMRSAANFKPLICGIITMAFFQATAYPILIGTTVELFRETNSNITAHLASIIVGIVIVISAMISVFLAKKCGRKTMLLASALAVSVSLFVFGAFYYLKETEDTHDLNWIPLVNFIFYIIVFMNGHGSVSWLICAEILPARMRPTLYPLVIASTWLMNFILTSLYSSMISSMGHYGTFWMFGTLSALGAVFIAACLPETRNKSESEISEFFS